MADAMKYAININMNICNGCGFCIDTCAFDVLEEVEMIITIANQALCSGCEFCEMCCPEECITISRL